MKDKELLVFAAKAAGYKFDSTEPFEIAIEHKGGTNWQEWNPKIDSSDSFNLIVQLGLEVNRVNSMNKTIVWYGRRQSVVAFDTECNNDANTATRLAVFYAAVEIGKVMP